MKKIFYFLFLSLLLTSCKQDDEDDVNIIVKTVNYSECYTAGEKIIFKIESFANKGYITSINISTVTSYGVTNVFDTLVNLEKINFMYEYNVPQFDNDTTAVKFYFKTQCSTGNYTEISKTYSVVGDIHLKPSEYTMYASYKNEKNGFSIFRNEVVDCETSDSTYIDIYDYSVDSTLVLSREWRTMTGIMFARFNDFDFENATVSSVYNAYSNSNKSTKLMNINNDDIILVGKEHALGVIKIINVFDDVDPMQDRYYFVYKGI